MGTACATERSKCIDDNRQAKLQGRQAAEGGFASATETANGAAPRGLQPLGLDAKRDGLLYVPQLTR